MRVTTDPLRGLRIGLHLLVLALLGLVLVRAASGPDPAPTVLAVIVMALVYAGGVTLHAGSPRPRVMIWAAALGAAWLVLLVCSSDAVWLAFPIFFLVMHLLPHPARLGAVVAVLVVVVVTYAWHGRLSPAAVIGPALGAAVAVMTVLGYEALHAESTSRQQLIDQLIATRRSLAQAQQAEGVLQERERLAREIHDTLAQGFTSIQLLLAAAERALPDRPAAAETLIEQARSTAVDNIAEARRFVRAMPPPGLETGSLSTALQALAGATRQRHGLEVSLAPVPEQVPGDLAVAVLRVVQAATANVVEHAHATHLRIDVRVEGGELVAVVADDGVGFETQAPLSSTDRGYGLSVMRARAAAVGGHLQLQSRTGAGTRVTLRAPWPGSAGREGRS